jgi:hypothetical protein
MKTDDPGRPAAYSARVDNGFAIGIRAQMQFWSIVSGKSIPLCPNML